MSHYTGKEIFVGLDVHKDSYSVSVICEGTLVKRDKLIALPKVLITYLKNFKGAHIKSAYEAGFCGFHLHRILTENGIDNVVVHPASIEVGARDSVKTDKRDSLKIATQLAAGRLSCVYIPTEEREDKRILTRLREQLVKSRNRIACQIKSLLHLHGLILPETSPRLCESWLKSINKHPMRKNFKYSLDTLFDNWKYHNSQISTLNKEIAKEAQEDKWLEDIYCSAPGIGPTSARKLINELYDMTQFTNEDKLFSYTGLTPKEHSSGEHVRQGHITRQGKPIIRRILVEAAWVAIRKDDSLATSFEKLAHRAGKKRAIVAIARMLLGRIRTCIKEKRLYRITAKDESKKAA